MPSPVTQTEQQAMTAALKLASQGPANNANPRVGCVIVRDGTTLGQGFHRGTGHPHAEVEAIANAKSLGYDCRGATAVVTLEPCRHSGATGPCTVALLTAGITRVIYAAPDPGSTSGGGSEILRGAGVDVVGDYRSDESRTVMAGWYEKASQQDDMEPARHVVWKMAATLDGRVAARDGTSQWITGSEARTHVHAYRAHADAIIIGTGTALTDNPSLTTRHFGTDAPRQPWRVAVGQRAIPDNARIRGTDGRFLHIPTRNPHDVMVALAERGAHRIIIEGGPTLAGAFLRLGLVDEIHSYLAPVLLGAGAPALSDIGVSTISDASRWSTKHVERLGNDIFLSATR